jgi:hypothetical protein
VPLLARYQIARAIGQAINRGLLARDVEPATPLARRASGRPAVRITLGEPTLDYEVHP